MKKGLKKIIFCLLTLLLLFGGPHYGLHAANCGTSNIDQICNPIPQQTIPQLALAVVTYLIGIIGVLSILFVIVGGFQYVTSAGNEETAKRAQRTITYSIIGLVVAVLSFAIVQISVNTLTQSTGSLINNNGGGGTGGGSTGGLGTGGGTGAGTGGGTGGGGTGGGGTGGTTAQNCTVSGVVQTVASPDTVNYGGSISLTPKMQGGMPANCQYSISVFATLVPSDSVHEGTVTQGLGLDGVSSPLPISSSIFNVPQQSARFNLVVTYFDSNNNELGKSITTLITVNQAPVGPPVPPGL